MIPLRKAGHNWKAVERCYRCLRKRRVTPHLERARGMHAGEWVCRTPCDYTDPVDDVMPPAAR